MALKCLSCRRRRYDRGARQPDFPAPNRRAAKARIRELLADNPALAERIAVIRDMGRRVRACEVHLTTACNIRCKRCWYFEGGFDQAVPETSDLGAIREFVEKLDAAGVTQATLIGGEPTLALNRILPHHSTGLTEVGAIWKW